MKKLGGLLLLTLLCALSALAQKETRQFSVGFGLEAGVPTGALSNLYQSALGLTIRFSYHVGPGFVTLTSGAVGYDPKSVPAGVKKKVGLEIPVRAGYKYITHHFFVMGELGYADFKSYYGENGALVSTSSGSFIAAPSAGVNFNAFEAGIRYGIDFKNNGGGVFGVRIGFNF